MAKDVKFQIRAEDKTTTAFRSVRNNLKSVIGEIGGMKAALIGAGAAVGGIYALKKGLEAVTGAAMQQRDAEEKLANVIRATGGAAGYSIEELKNMASAFQDLTTYGDEVILEGQSILATFKNIKGEAFEGATLAAMNMSTVMKQDLKSSMIQVGKALNDPIKGLTALSRVGVSFTEQQKQMIETMQNAGDMAGAQAVILQELEGEFGGAAENIHPFEKALTQLENVFGDLMETIGFGLTDNEAFVEILQQAKSYIEELIPYVALLVSDFIAWIGPADQINRKLDTMFRTVQAMLYPLKKFAELVNDVGAFLGTGAAALYTGAENLMQGQLSLEPQFAAGTGPAGLPSDGLYYGHKGEIVLNPTESQQARGGATVTVNFQPMFMTGDRAAGRAAADEIFRLLQDKIRRHG